MDAEKTSRTFRRQIACAEAPEPLCGFGNVAANEYRVVRDFPPGKVRLLITVASASPIVEPAPEFHWILAGPFTSELIARITALIIPYDGSARANLSCWFVTVATEFVIVEAKAYSDNVWSWLKPRPDGLVTTADSGSPKHVGAPDVKIMLAGSAGSEDTDESSAKRLPYWGWASASRNCWFETAG
jgi:hypothetical protein